MDLIFLECPKCVSEENKFREEEPLSVGISYIDNDLIRIEFLDRENKKIRLFLKEWIDNHWPQKSPKRELSAKIKILGGVESKELTIDFLKEAVPGDLFPNFKGYYFEK